MLGQVLPKNSKISFDIVNKLMTKREISSMIDQVYRHCGQKETVIFCDRVMALVSRCGRVLAVSCVLLLLGLAVAQHLR